MTPAPERPARQRVSDDLLTALLSHVTFTTTQEDNLALDLRDARATIAGLREENGRLRVACQAVLKSITRFPGSVHDRAVSKIEKAFDRVPIIDPDEMALQLVCGKSPPRQCHIKCRIDW